MNPQGVFGSFYIEFTQVFYLVLLVFYLVLVIIFFAHLLYISGFLLSFRFLVFLHIMNDTKEKMIYYYCKRGGGVAFASYNGSFLHLKDVMWI
jgi:hypothetical protein